MRTRLLICAAAAVLALAACERETYKSFDDRAQSEQMVVTGSRLSAGAARYAEAAPASPPPPPGAPVADDGAPSPDALDDAGTLLAYTYGASLELPPAKVHPVMEAHQEACRSAGVAVCQILSANVNENGPDYVYGNLSMRAAPEWLEGFREGLEGDAENADGRVTGTTVVAEDLTRLIVDTEAQLRAQTMLRDRLEGLLQTETKDVGDLLSVERELARVQGQIDSAQSQLQMMRRRVDMSTMNLSYASAPRPLSQNAFAPLGRAVNEFFEVFAEAAGMIVRLVAFLAPWAILAAPLLWLLRRWWRARRARKAAAPG